MAANRFCASAIARLVVCVTVCASVTGFASAGDPAPPPNLAPPITDSTAWQMAQAGGTATVTPDGTGVRIDVTSAGSAAWTAQLEAPVDLEDGKSYTLHFRAKADPPRTMGLCAGLTIPDYHLIGLETRAVLTNDWKPYDFTFQAAGVLPGHTDVPQFQVGNLVGKVWLSDVTITQTVAPPHVDDPLLVQLNPQLSEVKLVGTLSRVHNDGSSLTMMANQITLSGGWPRAIDPAKPKDVQWQGPALLLVAGGRWSLSDAQPGDTVIVAGRNPGDGQPLVARAVAIYPPDDSNN